jgi:hypothetical protein
MSYSRSPRKSWDKPRLYRPQRRYAKRNPVHISVVVEEVMRNLRNGQPGDMLLLSAMKPEGSEYENNNSDMTVSHSK